SLYPYDLAGYHIRSFFFQAEDGIRDGHVTGVQTCALPIYYHDSQHLHRRGDQSVKSPAHFRPIPLDGLYPQGPAHRRRSEKVYRSEERRVGKECRSWWVPYH